MSASLRDLQRRAYQQSVDKGFHDNEPAVGEQGWLEYDAMKIALIHSEASEALEELRAGHDPSETYYDVDPTDPANHGPFKPEGVPSEMADIVIRCMDYCGARHIDLEGIIERKLDYNATRSRMHGGKGF